MSMKEFESKQEDVYIGEKAGNVATVLSHGTAVLLYFPTVPLAFDLLSFQNDKPIMVMEYWAGWYDMWGQRHKVKSANGK